MGIMSTWILIKTGSKGENIQRNIEITYLIFLICLKKLICTKNPKHFDVKNKNTTFIEPSWRIHEYGMTLSLEDLCKF